MSSTETPFDLFISYSRLDNRPSSDADPVWVTALRDHILEDQRQFSTELLRIFFDVDEIRNMDDWRHRILGALRRSKILLVCLSPSYFASEYCRWEWEEYLRRQVHQQLGARHRSGGTCATYTDTDETAAIGCRVVPSCTEPREAPFGHSVCITY
jgi:predicted nucleotidyltransferase